MYGAAQLDVAYQDLNKNKKKKKKSMNGGSEGFSRSSTFA